MREIAEIDGEMGERDREGSRYSREEDRVDEDGIRCQ